MLCHLYVDDDACMLSGVDSVVIGVTRPSEENDKYRTRLSRADHHGALSPTIAPAAVWRLPIN